MKRAAACYVGKKDFCSFMAADSKVEDTVREVYEAEVERYGELITFRVRADGFLYNMVRIFVGTLIDVAYGKIEPEDISKIIEERDRRAAGSTAPPHGLYLNKVRY
jgi:tRNA pseudouridine38-40 synthase